MCICVSDMIVSEGRMHLGTRVSLWLCLLGGELAQCVGRTWCACILPLDLYVSSYVWICTCVCGSICVYRSGCTFFSVCNFVPASFYVHLPLNLFIPEFDSLVLSLGIHVSLPTPMRGSLALSCLSLQVSTHIFVIISPSVCMPLSFNSVFLFHSPPIPPFGFPDIFLYLFRYFTFFCFQLFLQCFFLLASFLFPAGLSQPLSTSRFLSQQLSFNALGSRFEPQLLSCLRQR